MKAGQRPVESDRTGQIAGIKIGADSDDRTVCGDLGNLNWLADLNHLLVPCLSTIYERAPGRYVHNRVDVDTRRNSARASPKKFFPSSHFPGISYFLRIIQQNCFCRARLANSYDRIGKGIFNRPPGHRSVICHLHSWFSSLHHKEVWFSYGSPLIHLKPIVFPPRQVTLTMLPTIDTDKSRSGNYLAQ